MIWKKSVEGWQWRVVISTANSKCSLLMRIIKHEIRENVSYSTEFGTATNLV